MRFYARMNAPPDSHDYSADASTSAAFYVNTNLNIVAYSNAVPVDLGVAMPTNA